MSKKSKCGRPGTLLYTTYPLVMTMNNSLRTWKWWFIVHLPSWIAWWFFIVTGQLTEGIIIHHFIPVPNSQDGASWRSNSPPGREVQWDDQRHPFPGTVSAHAGTATATPKLKMAMFNEETEDEVVVYIWAMKVQHLFTIGIGFGFFYRNGINMKHTPAKVGYNGMRQQNVRFF